MDPALRGRLITAVLGIAGLTGFWWLFSSKTKEVDDTQSGLSQTLIAGTARLGRSHALVFASVGGVSVMPATWRQPKTIPPSATAPEKPAAPNLRCKTGASLRQVGARTRKRDRAAAA